MSAFIQRLQARRAKAAPCARCLELEAERHRLLRTNERLMADKIRLIEVNQGLWAAAQASPDQVTAFRKVQPGAFPMMKGAPHA